MVIAAGVAAAAVTAGAGMLSSSQQAGAAEDAAQAQAQAADQAAKLQLTSDREARDLQLKMFNQLRKDQGPYRQAGYGALDRITGQLGGKGEFGKTFSMQDFQQDPGYAFRLQQGQKALEQSASARGMTLSGAQGQALQEYGQGLASEEYQNAWNRFETARGNKFNRLASIAGLGQTATQQTGQAGMATGANIANQMGQSAALRGDYALQGGNARASGYIGAANANTGMLNAAVGGLNQGVGNYFSLRNYASPATTVSPNAGVNPTSTNIYNPYS
jgi:hypothetical protein